MITKEKQRIRCFSFTEKPSRSRAAMTQPARNAGTGRHADPAGPWSPAATNHRIRARAA
jgi:hypothetical protein